MHICIPDTREVRPQQGGAYLLYNVHIDGLYHCSLRFKQLLHLHQALSRKFSGSCYYRLPAFPSKRLLPLSSGQVEERRAQLEKYLQNVSQDKAISNSSVFNLFLLEAQRESSRVRENQAHLDIELVNGQKIRLQIVTHDSADAILTSVCRALGLDDRYHAYFCLCLCGYDVVRDKLIIKRRLSFFEAPFITLQMAIQQQEQLQSVLATASSNSCCNIGAGGDSTSSNNLNYYPSENNNSNSNGNTCACLSCLARQQQQRQQAHSQSNSTSVPSIGSSSGSSNHFNHQQQQQLKHHHHNHHNHHHHRNSLHMSSGTRDESGCHLHSLASSSTATSRPFVTHRILLRKSYWDPVYDSYLLGDQQALNLLFIQTVYDIKHSLMFVDRQTYHLLESLLASDSKLEYILLARTLKYYNYVHFEPCYSDYPRPRTKVMISIGSKELNMRVLKSGQQAAAGRQRANGAASSQDERQVASAPAGSPDTNEPVLYCTSSLVPSGYQHLITKDDIVEEEYNFKVPLIRCWRLTSLETLNCGGSGASDHNNNNTNANCRAPGRSASSTPATTALAGGKRKSLSLFNSVVGSNSNTSSSSAAAMNNQPLASQHTVNGTDGASLLGALSGNSFFRCNNHNGHVPNNGSDVPSNKHLYCQHENQKCEPLRGHQQRHQPDYAQFCQYELSFEYLVSKDTLKWITISSDQAIFISISLQGVVDELVSRRDLDCAPMEASLVAPTSAPALDGSNGAAGQHLASGSSSSTNGAGGAQQTYLIPPLVVPPAGPGLAAATNGELVPSATRCADKFTYLSRDGSQKPLSAGNQQLIDKFGTTLGYSPLRPNSLAASQRHRQLQLAQAASRQGSALSFIGSPSAGSSSVAARMFAPVAGSFWSSAGEVSRSSALASSHPVQRRSLLVGQLSPSGAGGGGGPRACSFEISNLKKAPSPIINDAFEGATNDDDL